MHLAGLLRLLVPLRQEKKAVDVRSSVFTTNELVTAARGTSTTKIDLDPNSMPAESFGNKEQDNVHAHYTSRTPLGATPARRTGR